MLNPMMKRTRTRLGVVRPKTTQSRTSPSENTENIRNKAISAQQNYERYVTMAREALSMGDRIMSENYYQHAEHYLRLLKEAQPIVSTFDPPADLPEKKAHTTEQQPADATEYPTDLIELELELELQEGHKI